MKTIVYILIIFLALNHTDGYSQQRSHRYKLTNDTISADSSEYELIIFDPGFDVWLMTKPSKHFYSERYYEYHNRLYVDEWNYRYSTAMNHDEYDCYIDYDPRIDYGLDLNYRLYYYFKYFEEKHNTVLYPALR